MFSAGKVQLWQDPKAPGWAGRDSEGGPEESGTGEAGRKGTAAELRGLRWSSDGWERSGVGGRLFPRLGMAEVSFCAQECKGKNGWRAEVCGMGFGWNSGTRGSSWGCEGPAAHLGPQQRHQCPVSPVQLL